MAKIDKEFAERLKNSKTVTMKTKTFEWMIGEMGAGRGGTFWERLGISGPEHELTRTIVVTVGIIAGAVLLLGASC